MHTFGASQIYSDWLLFLCAAWLSRHPIVWDNAVIDHAGPSLLAICARVCIVWFDEAVPLLWPHRYLRKHPLFHREHTLTHLLRAVPCERRRQRYAENLQTVTVDAGGHGMGGWKDADQQHYKAEMIAWLKKTLKVK